MLDAILSYLGSIPTWQAVSGFLFYIAIGAALYYVPALKNTILKDVNRYVPKKERPIFAILAILVMCYWPIILAVLFFIWAFAPIWFKFKIWRADKFK